MSPHAEPSLGLLAAKCYASLKSIDPCDKTTMKRVGDGKFGWATIQAESLTSCKLVTKDWDESAPLDQPEFRDRMRDALNDLYEFSKTVRTAVNDFSTNADAEPTPYDDYSYFALKKTNDQIERILDIAAEVRNYRRLLFRICLEA